MCQCGAVDCGPFNYSPEDIGDGIIHSPSGCDGVVKDAPTITFAMHREGQRDGGNWWATTASICGWSAAADNRDELEDLCIEATHLFLRDSGLDIHDGYTVVFQNVEDDQ